MKATAAYSRPALADGISFSKDSFFVLVGSSELIFQIIGRVRVRA